MYCTVDHLAWGIVTITDVEQRVRESLGEDDFRHCWRRGLPGVSGKRGQPWAATSSSDNLTLSLFHVSTMGSSQSTPQQDEKVFTPDTPLHVRLCTTLAFFS